MAATFKSLVDIFLRKAAYEVTNSNTNAQTYLQTFILQSYTNSIAATGGAQIISVSVNGKTTTLQIPEGSWTQADVISAAEVALQLLESGFSKAPTSVTGIFI
jgi:hypothetical protein